VNAQRWKEIQVSFDELVELNASDQATRLEMLARSDPEQHRALELLLKADASAAADLRLIDTAFLLQSDRGPDPLGLTGRTISHFDLGDALGAGGMGVVYRAHDTRLGRVVALKFLFPHYNLDASAKARFLREAHAAAALDHPNLCTVHEVGTSDEGWLFLAMAHKKLGNHDQARKAHEQAVQWLEKNSGALAKNKTQAEELGRFRSEAEEVLGLKKK
jgi:tetratricopeptide (TPR) repeat protein